MPTKHKCGKPPFCFCVRSVWPHGVYSFKYISNNFPSRDFCGDCYDNRLRSSPAQWLFHYKFLMKVHCVFLYYICLSSNPMLFTWTHKLPQTFIGQCAQHVLVTPNDDFFSWKLIQRKEKWREKRRLRYVAREEVWKNKKKSWVNSHEEIDSYAVVLLCCYYYYIRPHIGSLVLHKIILTV